MKTAASSALDKESVSHNLLGQRLGRKGRDTRERILAATEKLLAGPPGTQISLSAVAREASLGMTTLYLYFGDLIELLLAVLEGIMATAEDSYVGHLRERWPDETLGEQCLKFVDAYHAFWVRHSRILHLRNAYSDDPRMREQRMALSGPMVALLSHQMDAADPADINTPAAYMATVLLTGVERLITVTTDATFVSMVPDPTPRVREFMRAEARLLELAIADARAAADRN
jgi:AcrR family transcriptional regulator